MSKPKVALSVLAATAVNVGAYCTPHRLPAAIISTALLYRFMAQAQMRKVSIRMTCIALLSWLALTAVFSAGLIMLLIKSGVMEDQPDATYKDGEVRIMMIDPEQQPSDDLMSSNVARYVNLLLPFVWSAGPGFLVSKPSFSRARR